MNPLPSKGSVRIPGDTATEAAFDGLGTLSPLVRIVSSNVEINGLEFRNSNGDMVVSEVPVPTAHVVLRNNIVHDSSGDEGIQLRSVDGAVIECNHVTATAGDGINLCCGSVDGVVRFNEVHDIHSPDAAIYVYDASETLIEGNLVYVTTSNDGIKLGSKNGDDASKSGGEILNNTVQNTAQDGIAVYRSDATVRCNDVSGSTSENGGIYTAWAVSGVSVVDNYIHDNAFDTAKWGDPGGPSGAGSGTGDAVSTSVNYAPWLLSAPSPSCPAIGECGEAPVPVNITTWGRIKTRYR